MSKNEPNWDVLRSFHGHLGPWLVMGLKAGAAALQHLGARKHFGVEVDAWYPDAPPPSCFIDGLQWGTGATYGKRNIRLHPSEDFRAVVRDKETQNAVEIRLQADTRRLVREWFDALGDEASSQKVWNTPDDELFVIVPLSEPR